MKATKTKNLIKKVSSIPELRRLAENDSKYYQLAIRAALNLGARGVDEKNTSSRNLELAIDWLNTNAQETSEEGVVEEINYVRDLV